MATSKPGPLVGEIKGSVGGVTFQGGPGDQFIRSRIKPVHGNTGYQVDCRNLMARASTTWSTLSEVDRVAWERMAGGRSAGYVQYLRSWLSQIGAAAIEAPLVPQSADRPAPIGPTTAEDLGDLMLVGLTRDLTSDEEMICRVYDQVPRTWRKVRYKTHGYESVAYGEGLGAAENIVQNVASDPSGIAYNATAIWPGTTWTIEMWIRPDTDQAGTHETLIELDGGSHIIYWRVDPNWFMGYDGAYRNLGSCPGHDQWFYIALVADGTAGLLDVYVNGQLYAESIIWAAVALTGNKSMGNRASSPTRWLEGRWGPVRVSKIKRSPTEIETIWNDGRGRAFATDADTMCLLIMDETTGGTLYDRVLGYHDWTRSNLGNAWGPFCRTLYADADRVMPEGRVNIASRIKDLTRLAGASWLDRVDY